MPMLNRHVFHAHISEAKFCQVLKGFALDLEADQAAELTALSHNGVNRYFRAIRQRIARLCKDESPFKGEVEVDESYFGARRIKGERGRGAYGKINSLWLAQVKWKGLCRDCAGLPENDVSGDHPGSCGT